MNYKLRIYKKLYILLFVFLFFISGCGIVPKYRILKIDKSQWQKIKINAPKKEFRVGEKFTYKAEWMGMDVGRIILTIEKIEKMNGREAYHIMARANSTAIVSKLYKVEDVMSTYIDKNELYSLRFEKEQREGGYRSSEYTDFDQKKGKAYYFSRLNKTKKEINIPKKVQDPLSALYYFRLQNIIPGESMFCNVNIDEKNYLLEAKVHKKARIKIKNVGEWDAFLVEPLPWFQGKIKRKAKASVWFSADDRRIPLLLTTKGIPLVGAVSITLQKIE